MRRSGRSLLRRRDPGPAARCRREAFVIGLPDGVRVYLAAGRTDLRRGIDGLAPQTQTVLREDPFSGHLFIFRGRAAHTIKVLMYDGSGFLLMQKRLTEGKFIWPSPADGIVTISRAQMSLLIDGLDWRSAKARSVAKPLFIVRTEVSVSFILLLLLRFTTRTATDTFFTWMKPGTTASLRTRRMIRSGGSPRW